MDIPNCTNKIDAIIRLSNELYDEIMKLDDYTDSVLLERRVSELLDLDAKYIMMHNFINGYRGKFVYCRNCNRLRHEDKIVRENDIPLCEVCHKQKISH